MENLYTVKEVASFLKVHHLTIRRYIKSGTIKSFKAGGNVRITGNDLERFLKQSKQGQKVGLIHKLLGGKK